MIGKSIAHYKITGKLGEGGMGEVYRAADTKLNREVALKLLPEQFSADAQRMGRFQREAEVLASLSHSNIGHIYGIEEAGTTQALVLELIEGPTLSERIEQGPVPLDEALQLTLQIVAALEAAHDKGIIHRDLKPANIKITPEGQVKVLDFGLARAMEAEQSSSPDLTQSPTLSMAATQAGMILGTAGYMSPEQARGRVADRRADVWAVGAVLFEMLSGVRAFDGEDVSMVLAHVLSQEPNWDALPADLPAPIKDIVQRSLRKDPRNRLQAVGDIRIAIEEYLAEPEVGGEATEVSAAASPQTPAWQRFLPWGVAAVLLSTSLFFAFQPSPEIPLRKLEIPEPLASFPRISPDGQFVAYFKEDGLWIRRLDQLEPRRVEGTGEAFQRPFWSPDSRYVGYLSGPYLWKVSVSEGSGSIITDYPGGFPLGGSWGEDGFIAYFSATGQYKVSEGGGDPETLALENLRLKDPHHLPDGMGIMAVDDDAGTIVLLPGPDYSEVRTLLQIEGASLEDPVYSPSGHIVYGRTGTNEGIWAVPFSLSSIQVTGEDFLVTSVVGVPSISKDGTLLYSQFEGDTALRQLVRVDRSGDVIEEIGTPARGLGYLSLSPDRSRIAIEGTDAAQDTLQVWVYDLAGRQRRLTFEERAARHPVWHPDGTEVYFSSFGGASALKKIPADGSSAAQVVVEGSVSQPRFSSDARYLIYFRREGPGNNDDILMLDTTGDGQPVPFLATPIDEDYATISPDGNYVAYESQPSGRDDVFLKKFPSGEGLWQVSVDGGRRPQWSPDGKELFFEVSGNVLMSVEVDTSGSDPLKGNPRRLFQLSRLMNNGRWAVDDDGTFIMVQRGATSPSIGEDGRAPSISVVQNWFREFEKR